MSVEVETLPDQKYVFYALRPTVEFKVKTVCNAFVMLSKEVYPAEGDSVIEVFLGTLGNTESVIRTNRSKAETTTVKTPNILSPMESRGFWLNYGENTIQVGKENETKPFMSREVFASMAYNHIGICSGYGAEGEWVISGETFRTHGNLDYVWMPLRCYLRVNVQAEKNAIVALTSGPSNSSPIYELAIGGWDNLAVAIRYNKKTPEKAYAEIPNLLSKDGSMSFCIYFHQGLVRLTKGDETASLIEWQDPKPFNVTHFGVRSRTTAKWNIKVGCGVLLFKQAPALAWVRGTKGVLPPNSVVGGLLDPTNISGYVGRVYYENALQPGFVVGTEGYMWAIKEDSSSEIHYSQYEYLTGTNFKWQPSQNVDVPFNAVVGGYDNKGSPLFIGRATERIGRIIPGKGCYHWNYDKQQVEFSEKGYDILLQE